jgi:hypothetical protein
LWLKLTTSTIEQTVTSLDSLVDLVGASVVVDLPQTEAHDGHLVAAVQLDSGRNHFGEIPDLNEIDSGRLKKGSLVGFYQLVAFAATT